MWTITALASFGRWWTCHLLCEIFQVCVIVPSSKEYPTVSQSLEWITNLFCSLVPVLFFFWNCLDTSSSTLINLCCSSPACWSVVLNNKCHRYCMVVVLFRDLDSSGSARSPKGSRKSERRELVHVVVLSEFIVGIYELWLCKERERLKLLCFRYRYWNTGGRLVSHLRLPAGCLLGQSSSLGHQPHPGNAFSRLELLGRTVTGSGPALRTSRPSFLCWEGISTIISHARNAALKWTGSIGKSLRVYLMLRSLSSKSYRAVLNPYLLSPTVLIVWLSHFLELFSWT